MNQTNRIFKPGFESGTPKAPRKKRRWLRNTLLIILLVLIGLRIALPYIVLHLLNKQLAGIKEYYGHIADVDIHLYRGAYVVKDMYLVKLEREEQNRKTDSLPFFKVPVIDLSVEWKSLFKGRVVGEVYMEEPVINFVKGRHKGEDLKADTADLRDLSKAIMPLTVNHFEISNGEVHYIDKSSNPRIDIALKEVYAVATNISNVADSSKLLPARLDARAKAYGGVFNLLVNFDILKNKPTFDLTVEMKGLELTGINDLLKAYGNFDVKKGRFDVYAEFAAKNGEFGGYVKPLMHDLDIVQWNKEEGNIGQILWETLVGTVAEVLTNRNTGELATKVNIKGRFDEPSVNIWRAVSFVLRNAFLQALKPSVDNSISINQLSDAKKKTLLERLFGSGKNSNAKKEEKKTRREERREKRKKGK